jgi:hypothetical protein
MIFALRPLQKDPDQKNQAANDPTEDLGVLGPFPIFHFAFAFIRKFLAGDAQTAAEVFEKN